MKLFQIIGTLSMLLPFSLGGSVRSSSNRKLEDDESGPGINFPGPGIGGGGGIGSGNRPQCTFRGIPPFITEEYIVFRYEGPFDWANITDIIDLDTAFVTAYDSLVNCSSVPGSERDMFDAEFLQVDFNTTTFLLRTGYFCNSCNEFRNIFNQTCTETNGPEAGYHIDVYLESLFATPTPPGPDECDCPAPESDEVIAVFNELLDYPGFSITGTIQLCPQPECERDEFITTYSLQDGVCLASSLLPLSSAPSEYPSEYPSEFPSEEPTETDEPTGTDDPTVEPTAFPTAAPSLETDAPVTDAPVTDAPVTTPAPATPAPATPAPATPAPATPAPVDVTPAPATPAPVDVTPAPVDPTPAPVVDTPAPVDPTPAPVVETPAPVDPTPAPVVDTPSPVVNTPGDDDDDDDDDEE